MEINTVIKLKKIFCFLVSLVFLSSVNNLNVFANKIHKVLILGEDCSGKMNLWKRFCGYEFDEPYSNDKKYKQGGGCLSSDGSLSINAFHDETHLIPIRIEDLDLSKPNPKFTSMMVTGFEDTELLIICINSQDKSLNTSNIYSYVQKFARYINNPRCQILLCATKCDSEPTEKIQNIMNKAVNSEYRIDNGTYISPVQKILYTSAKNNTGIQKLKDTIAEIFSKKTDINHVHTTKNQNKNTSTNTYTHKKPENNIQSEENKTQDSNSNSYKNSIKNFVVNNKEILFGGALISSVIYVGYKLFTSNSENNKNNSKIKKINYNKFDY